MLSSFSHVWDHCRQRSPPGSPSSSNFPEELKFGLCIERNRLNSLEQHRMRARGVHSTKKITHCLFVSLFLFCVVSKPFRNGAVWEGHWRCWDLCKAGINSVEIPLLCLILRTGQALSVWFAFWDFASLLSLFLAMFLYFGPIFLPIFPLFSMGRGEKGEKAFLIIKTCPISLSGGRKGGKEAEPTLWSSGWPEAEWTCQVYPTMSLQHWDFPCEIHLGSQGERRGVKSSPGGVCCNRFPWNCVVKYPRGWKIAWGGGNIVLAVLKHELPDGKGSQDTKNRMRIP